MNAHVILITILEFKGFNFFNDNVNHSVKPLFQGEMALKSVDTGRLGKEVTPQRPELNNVNEKREETVRVSDREVAAESGLLALSVAAEQRRVWCCSTETNSTVAGGTGHTSTTRVGVNKKGEATPTLVPQTG